MRTRAKALTVAAAMVLTFAILPTLGAAAAEPLEDGSYDVVIAETTYTVEVVEGAPEVEGADDVAFTFEFDEDDRVLDEFDVVVDGVTYEVEIGEDGAVEVTEDDAEEPAGEEGASDEDSEGQDGDDDGDASSDEDEESDEDDSDDLETLDATQDDEDDEDDGAHGAVVSTVAQCAPSGWQARAAGLPNHGFFVSAAAKGEEVEFEAGDDAHSADLSSQEGADAFCELADELLAAAEDDAETADGADGDAASARGNGKDGERGNGKGRANAPGQLKKNG